VGPRPGLRHYHLLYSGAARLVRTLDLSEALEGLEADLHNYVAVAARKRVFVHAGVVGWKGRALLIPGRSFSGKTTLVAALVKAGATYYSDEFAVLDEKGRVYPFPKQLSIRGEEGGKGKRCAVKALGGRAGSRPLPVGLILVSNYRKDARWRPRSLSAGRGALALLDNTVPARLRPEAAMAVVQQVVSNAPVLKGVRGEADEVAAAVLSRIGAWAGSVHELS